MNQLTVATITAFKTWLENYPVYAAVDSVDYLPRFISERVLEEDADGAAPSRPPRPAPGSGAGARMHSDGRSLSPSL